MRDLRVKREAHNPNAAVLTPTGWQMPDGTFKPHDMPRPAMSGRILPVRKWWRR